MGNVHCLWPDEVTPANYRGQGSEWVRVIHEVGLVIAGAAQRAHVSFLKDWSTQEDYCTTSGRL